MSAEKAKMEITNPRRILAVSLTDSAQHLSDVIKDLTGTHPSPSSGHLPPDRAGDTRETPTTAAAAAAAETAEEEEPSENNTLAGTTHPLPLATPYYTASVPVWLDLVPSPPEWAASFLSPEAREVLAVLGGVVVVFALPSGASAEPPLPAPGEGAVSAAAGSGSGPALERGEERRRARELIAQVGRVVREGLGGWEWDGVGLAVGVGQGGGSAAGWEGDGGELDEWEDLCAESGLEFVHVPRAGAGGSGDGKGAEADRKNEFGERMGMARVLEALKANDWSGGELEAGADLAEEDDEPELKGKGRGAEDEEDDDEFDPEKLDFGFDKEDFVGLRKAIWSGGRGDGEGSKGEHEEDEEVGEEDVQQLERMMLKLQAVRDASAGLPEEQRKRMAARAVGEVMKEL